MYTLAREFSKAKIMIIIKEVNYPEFELKELNCSQFELSPLTLNEAKCLLSLKLKDKTDISVGLSEYGKLIKNYEVLKIPKVINSLAHSFINFENKVTY